MAAISSFVGASIWDNAVEALAMSISKVEVSSSSVAMDSSWEFELVFE